MTLAWVFQAAADDPSSVSPVDRARTVAGVPNTPKYPSDIYGTYVERIRRGDADALDALYRALYAPLVNFALHLGVSRAIAEEIVQETFLALWRTRERWDVRGTVREYVFGAVRNRVTDHRRHERVVQSAADRVGGEHVAGIAHAGPLPDVIVTEAELREALDTVLNAMPSERRQVLVLRWQEQLSYPEIAAILGISVNAAKQQGSRAQRVLRELLQRFRP